MPILLLRGCTPNRTTKGVSKVSATVNAISSRLQTLSAFTVQCAWCGKVKRQGGYSGEAGPLVHKIDGKSVSHGICPSCLDNLVTEMRGTWDPSSITFPTRGGFMPWL